MLVEARPISCDEAPSVHEVIHLTNGFAGSVAGAHALLQPSRA